MLYQNLFGKIGRPTINLSPVLRNSQQILFFFHFKIIRQCYPRTFELPNLMMIYFIEISITRFERGRF